MKSESGFSLAMASQPICKILTATAAFKFCKNATQNNNWKVCTQKKIQRDNLQQNDSNDNLQSLQKQSGTKLRKVWCGTRLCNFFKQNFPE